MKVIETELPGVVIIEPRVFADNRGFFKETYQTDRYRNEAGIDCTFVQDNVSRSSRGTLRGLHFQIEHAQAKLVQALKGEIFDVAVDVRRDSPHFGKWTGVVLSEENHKQLFVPAGFAHGFFVLSDTADISYKCDNGYHPEHERTLLWNDADVNVNWPVDGVSPILSDKDVSGTPFAELECYETTP